MIFTREELIASSQSKHLTLMMVFRHIIPPHIQIHDGGSHNEFLRFEFSAPIFGSLDKNINEDFEITKNIIHYLGGKIISQEGSKPIIALF